MKPWRALGRVLATGTVTLLVAVLAPAVLLFGELVNRHYLRGLPPGRDRIRVRRRGRIRRRAQVVVVRQAGPGWATYAVAARNRRVAGRVLANPLWIALTAPVRWLLDHLRPRAGGRRGRGNGPPGAGVREPRRPLPDLPAGAMALPEPGPYS